MIILLTDGVNNSGFIDPKIATELAMEYDIKTYTIGIGTNGMALAPIAMDRNGRIKYGSVKVEIDEELMKKSLKKQAGNILELTDNDKLEAIYDEINKLETTEVEEFKYYNYDEKYRPLLLLAGVLLLIEFVLKRTIFRSFV